MRQYNDFLNRSAVAFRKFVEPLILNKWGARYIYHCEGHETGLAGKLDHDHCVDFLIIGKHGELHGLSNRTLFKRRFVHKVTLRKERVGEDGQREPSEYVKIKRAIRAGDVHPDFVCCACVADDALLSAVVLRAPDVINFIDETNPPLLENYDRDKKQKQLYFLFDWRDVERRGFDVWKLKDPDK